MWQSVWVHGGMQPSLFTFFYCFQQSCQETGGSRLGSSQVFICANQTISFLAGKRSHPVFSRSDTQVKKRSVECTRAVCDHQTRPSAFALSGTRLFTHAGAKQKGMPIMRRKPACHYLEDRAESTAIASSNLSCGDQGV